ncbi:hypothetical protein EDD18DRAFT_1334817 [Armillaria luteobubalina]|uniref:Uncharacterized protein n=1 Tax=Armillaria luteobubalina TaxID=153913 RepID=A0AA39PT25_9AGAR|nr:hypothetical protein EDD18DRAFT_1334817 [Armillaria luteobubalina]
MGDKKPQVIGPLNLCFSLKKNGVYIEVDQSVAAELDTLATELLDTEDKKLRNQVRKRLQEKLLSICDGWTVLNGRKVFRDYPKLKAAPDASNGEGNTIVDKFVNTVNSHPWRGRVPSEGLEQWRDQLLGLVQSMSIQDREEACGRVPNPVWIELVKPSLRAKHLDVLMGSIINKHDISDWCFPQVALSGYQLASGPRPKKQLIMSDDSDYRGRICTDGASFPLPTTRQADKEFINAVDGAACGQKRPSSPSNNHNQYGAMAKRSRTDERDMSSAETQKTLVIDYDSQDRTAAQDTERNKELQSTNESLKAEIADLKAVEETILRKLRCLQADITHLESIVQALRKDE